MSLNQTVEATETRGSVSSKETGDGTGGTSLRASPDRSAKNMRIAASVILCSLLSGCADHNESALLGLSEWPFPDAVEVRAFQFDAQTNQPRSLIWRGRLTEHRNPSAGALLSNEQVERLRSIVVHREEARSPSLCYVPNHGFVFYGSDLEKLGYIELSFQCYSGFSRTKTQMSGKPPYTQDAVYLTDSGWRDMVALFEELGLYMTDSSSILESAESDTRTEHVWAGQPPSRFEFE